MSYFHEQKLLARIVMKSNGSLRFLVCIPKNDRFRGTRSRFGCAMLVNTVLKRAEEEKVLS